MKISRSDVRCLLLESLLGKITSNVRSVTTNVSTQEFVIKFYYENDPDGNETDLLQSTIKKIAARFTISIVGKQITLPKPEPIPLKKGDQWIFCKYENNPSLFKIKTFFKHISKTNILMASQFALLGNVTDNLRAVSVIYVENDLDYFFFYDMEPSYYDRNFSDRVINAVIWSIEGVSAKLERFVMPETQKIPFQEGHMFLYKRYEKQINSC